jgi:FdrA protein
MHIETYVKKNVYFDSMVLMQLTSRILKQPGVSKAQVMMGTDENRRTIKNKELLTNDVLSATPNDLFIVVEATDEDSAKNAVTHALESLDNKQDQSKELSISYKSLKGAITNSPAANLVAISLPGKYAYAEAKHALESDLNVFLFSDNVPLDEEISLKQIAKRCIVMGPDCGTAIIGGAALGFANAARRGTIGIVGASGTGIQEVTTLIHKMGSGISHAIGTGGRDVKEEVGGGTLIAGLEWLAADPGTKVILIVSKPPSESVRDHVLKIIRSVNKPVVVNLLGSSEKEYKAENTFIAETMEDAATLAVMLDRGEHNRLYSEEDLVSISIKERSLLTPEQKYYRGLFSGGTFANEAALIISKKLNAVYGNISMPNILPLDDPFLSIGHSCVDMGDDIFTVGKPHPILAPELRRERMLSEAADPETGLIFLDIVIGFGCHPDPATEFTNYIVEAKEIAAKQGRHLPVIVYLAGVEDDPQKYSQQVKILETSGAIVAPTNAVAARLACGILTGEIIPSHEFSDITFKRNSSVSTKELPFDLPNKANVINIGLKAFGESLESQSIPVTYVSFSPPASGDSELMQILDDLL